MNVPKKSPRTVHADEDGRSVRRAELRTDDDCGGGLVGKKS